jgi:GNAT superfamily N-acetyltransferase
VRGVTAACQRVEVQAQQIDIEKDVTAFEDWFAIWHTTDLEKFPDEPGWDEQDIRSMAAQQNSTDHRFLLIRTDAGEAIGAAILQLPQRDNRHASWLELRVLQNHRRRGVGRALLDDVERLVRADGRSVINSITDVPVAQQHSHPPDAFARSMGFVQSHAGHRRSLNLPIEPGRLEALRQEVAGVRGASDYRMFTFLGQWPDAFIEDQCELERAMSTDQPLGDRQAEEEQWDAARVAEATAELTAQGMVSLSAAAQHAPSGRLVAYTRMVIAERRPTEAWQWATVVLHEHRGHRLGLAVKLANLDFLSSVLPTARHVITSNAAVNGPMIAVNDKLGFEIDAVGAFWQKTLSGS